MLSCVRLVSTLATSLREHSVLYAPWWLPTAEEQRAADTLVLNRAASRLVGTGMAIPAHYAGVRDRGRTLHWSGATAVAALAVLLAGAASWYGVLEHEKGHPAIRLVGALALAALGVILVVLAAPRSRPANGDHTVGMILALLSMAAALIHFAVIDQHRADYWLYGLFFIVVGIAQLGWALLMPRVRARWLLAAGATGNALVVVAWIVTRTAGSLVGPEASMPAKVGFGDLVSTIIEAVLVVGAIGVLSRRLRAPAGTLGEHTWMIIGLVMLPFVVLGLYSAVGGSPFVSEVG
jgi:hypothetical protein